MPNQLFFERSDRVVALLPAALRADLVVKRVGHTSSLSIRFALELGRSPLAIQSFISESPFEGHIFRNVAFAIVARLITERSFDGQLTSRSNEGLQSSFLSEGDFANDLDPPAINRNRFADR